MPKSMNSTAARRVAPSVQFIRSPLTRAGYALEPNGAHLLLLLSGSVELREPSGRILLRIEAPRLVWRHETRGDELVAESGTRAALVSIADIALMRALPTSPLGDQMRRTLNQNLALLIDDPARISALIEGLAMEKRGGEPGSDAASEHFLGLLLIQLWRLARADLVAHGRAPLGLAERFVLLASQHAREHWRVEDYARTLGISKDRLGTAVRRATSLSPQAYLHRSLIREACELLANTGIPLTQVAFRLGFSDPAYFNRFFTRQTGAPPGRYRRKAMERRTAGDKSYAAWP